MTGAQFWLPTGTKVGTRYELCDVLGIGGYGITYRGIDTHLNRIVAIKEFFPSFWASRFVDNSHTVKCHPGMEESYAKGMQRFLDEARILVQLSYIREIVRVNDYFEQNGTAYLVMDFLDGKHLKQVADASGGRIAPNVLFSVMEPIILALKQVHESGMVHRDISPDNIMVLKDGSVRLIDFGNARDTTDNKSMTLAMKQGFAAPEQYRSKGQGPWTDVYGVCATMYYCLTGKLPPQALERLTGAPFPTPSELGVFIDEEREQVILDGLELYVNRRIQTMDELWNRLYSASRQGSLSREEYAPTASIPHNEKTVIATEVVEQSAQTPARVGAIEYIRNLCAQIFRRSND